MRIGAEIKQTQHQVQTKLMGKLIYPLLTVMIGLDGYSSNIDRLWFQSVLQTGP